MSAITKADIPEYAPATVELPNGWTAEVRVDDDYDGALSACASVFERCTYIEANGLERQCVLEGPHDSHRFAAYGPAAGKAVQRV